MENERIMELENGLKELVNQLKRDANMAAFMANAYAKDGDANRNRANFGNLTQALKTLNYLDMVAKHDTWEDAGMLVVEKVTVKGEVIYERPAR